MAIRVDIRGILGSLGTSEGASGSIALEDVTLGECDFSFPLPATYDVTLTNTGAGVVAGGTVSAAAHTRCVRCLCAFDAEICGDVEGFYVLPGHDEGLPEEQEVEYIAENEVDLEAAILQALVLALPYAPVHSPDCRGLCPTCGADLNVTECGCDHDEEASPFAVLRDLLGGDEDTPDDGGDAGSDA